jgi:hypothetical protein
MSRSSSSPAVTEPTPTHLTIASHREYQYRGIYYRVLVDGEDVTERCESAIAGDPGSAHVMVVDAKGHILVDPEDRRQPLRTILTGRVEFVPGLPPFSGGFHVVGPDD